MPKIIQLPVTQTLPLFPKEVGDDTTITIKPVTIADTDEIERAGQAERRIVKDGAVEIFGSWTTADQKRFESWKTVVSSNLLDSDSKPFFVPGMTYEAFRASWGRLPPEIANRIYELVVEVNPVFDPN